ncbi:STAS domain-containing protein [Paraglaciecola aquimarina]|uniref:STAS domain-containing protein n=1 Tax=Paraglaciecola algarum TaxID=3050085 RepID=A0ABS9D1A8_9ALTE|nr:STAS domain-containing protein [Paraglaciecola sp. G1-23]MCF2946709.1 STAS domain-containing protein [Paraglaciecola sp. G1-23]
MSLDRAFSDDGKLLTIFIDEKFDFSQVQGFRTAYSEGTETVTAIVIDLQNTEYMDSSALGMLLNMQKAMKDKVTSFKIKHAKPQVSRILQIARFGKKFEFC